MVARWIEITTGAVGAVLVALAVVLVPYLPEQEYSTPQFRITFPETFTDGATQSHEFTADNETFLFDFEVTEGNLSSILVAYTFIDDAPASNPDRFRIELVAPNGTVVGHATTAATAVPRLDGSTPPRYIAESVSLVSATLVFERPVEALVAAASRAETPQQALQRVAPQFASDGTGKWSVRVTLVEAGDCPGPDLDLPRSVACREENTEPGNHPVNSDAGNAFHISLWRTVHYHAALAPEA